MVWISAVIVILALAASWATWRESGLAFTLVAPSLLIVALFFAAVILAALGCQPAERLIGLLSPGAFPKTA